MTHLHPLNSSHEAVSTVEHQEQGVPSVQVAPEKQIPKLYDIAFTFQLGVFNQLSLAERVIEIQNTTLPQNIKMRFFQPAIERKLKEAKTDDAILALFQEIKDLCSEGTDFNPDLFRFYMKPIIQKVGKDRLKVGKGRSMVMTLQDFLAKTKAFSEDPALSEMFGLRYVCTIHNQEDLSFIFREQTFVTQIRVTYEMGNVGAVALADALKENRMLTSLSLGSSQIGDEGARALAEALKVNRTLTSLDLWDNNIGDEGARALAEILKENETLTSLGLMYNQIGDEGAGALAEALKENRTLTSLDLAGNGIGDAGARALAEVLKGSGTLTSLDFYNNQIGDEGARALAESLKGSGTLISITLGGNQIGAAGARALADALKENRMLTSLTLCDNQIGDAVKQLWREMRTLYPTRKFQF